jgi:thiol-disulfide isomerase/thioredoxin
MRFARWFAALATVIVIAGCSSDPGYVPPPQETPASPFEPCPASGGQAPAGSGSESVPALTLPCFTGGEPVSLAALGKPAVINLWASSCAPCRTELPVLQDFADAAGDQVVVLGVVTGDTWNAAAYAGVDFGISFPAVFDPDRTVLSALGRNAIPVTLFVDAAGTVRHSDVSGALRPEKLRALAAEHLGITL